MSPLEVVPIPPSLVHPRTGKAVEVEYPEIPQGEEARPSSSGTVAVKEIFNRVTAKSSASKQGGSMLSAKAAREEALSTLSATRLATYNKLSKGPAPSTGFQKVMHHCYPNNFISIFMICSRLGGILLVLRNLLGARQDGVPQQHLLFVLHQLPCSFAELMLVTNLQPSKDLHR